MLILFKGKGVHVTRLKETEATRSNSAPLCHSPVGSSPRGSLCFSSFTSRDSIQNLKPCSASSALKQESTHRKSGSCDLSFLSADRLNLPSLVLLGVDGGQLQRHLDDGIVVLETDRKSGGFTR